MVYAGLLFLIVGIFVAVDRNETCDFDIKTWLIVVMGDYLLDIILIMI